jgi:hypothetical protein
MLVRNAVAACLAACAVPVSAREAGKGRPVPVYTNDDLARVSPLRGQTGVLSAPAEHAAERAAAPGPAKGPRERGEEYWRREARRVRDRVGPLRQKADDLRARIADRRRRPGVRPYTDPQVQADERRLGTLETRIRELESELEDRARREGALPGWLR